ncbi:electron transfer flavoprotein subunit alpha/FixB family protein [soil metagenome]
MSATQSWSPGMNTETGVVVLVLVEGQAGELTELSRQALTVGRALAGDLNAGDLCAGEPTGAGPVEVHGVTVGAGSDELARQAGRYGAAVVHQLHHDLLTEYGPETWGAGLSHTITALEPVAVLAAASDRGSEVMAHAAATLDLPLATNCLAVTPGPGPWALRRVRWGGSLLEEGSLDAPVRLVTIAPHAIAASPVMDAAMPKVQPITPTIDAVLARTMVTDRVGTSTGVTLAEAPVVVGGGRGVGSADGFAPLEELAELLGGKVGCSRVVTNSGWRPHADQVGQTGTHIAPQIYIACGISGAIQHWAGAKGSKHILAINTDPDANMVARADYAVIGDLHEVVPAIVAALKARNP